LNEHGERVEVTEVARNEHGERVDKRSEGITEVAR